jgi:hypothetical protein
MRREFMSKKIVVTEDFMMDVAKLAHEINLEGQSRNVLEYVFRVRDYMDEKILAMEKREEYRRKNGRADRAQ